MDEQSQTLLMGGAIIGGTLATGGTLPLALALGGTFMGSMGALQGANAQARAAREQQAMRNEQAKEILARAQINAKEMLRAEAKLTGNQVSAFAKAGVDVGAGSPLTVYAQSIADSRRAINNMLKEAEFRARVIRQEGMASGRLASEIMGAGRIQAGAGAVRGVANILMSMPGAEPGDGGIGERDLDYRRPSGRAYAD
jgi:hypothetical protein